MSEPLRFKPVNPAHEMIYSADGGWVSWEDYARLKAEVEARQKDMNEMFREIKEGREAYQRLHHLYLTAKEVQS